jgi:PKD repeat protein
MLSVLLGSAQPPFRLIGSGTWAGFGGLVLLFVFVVLNLIADSHSRPVIAAVKASPIGVAPGKYVDLDVEASDKSGERLSYLWTFQGKPISTLRNAYLKAPDTAGTYPVTVRVSNERVGVQSTLSLEVIPEKPTTSSALTTTSSNPDTVANHGGRTAQESDPDQHAQRTGSGLQK